MNFLKNVNPVFNKKQKELLMESLNRRVDDGSIIWQKTFDDEFEDRLNQIQYPMALERIATGSLINYKAFDWDYSLIDIDILSLQYENYTLNNLINQQQMLRKDNVNTNRNIMKNKEQIVNHKITADIINKVDVEDSIIKMQPTVSIEYDINKISAEIFPDERIELNGNTVTIDNVLSANNDYWLVELLTASQVDAGAYVYIEFGGIVKANYIEINYAGKYPIVIDKIEFLLKDDGDLEEYYQSVDFKIRQNGKILEIFFEDPITFEHKTYYTSEIKITIMQPRYDYIWEKEINDENEILKGTITINDNVKDILYKDFYHFDNVRTLNNLYSYMLGFYSVKVMFKKYSVSLFEKTHVIVNPDAPQSYFTLSLPYSVGYKDIKLSKEGFEFIPYPKRKLGDLDATHIYYEERDNTTVLLYGNNGDRKLVDAITVDYIRDSKAATFLSDKVYLEGHNKVIIEADETLRSPFTINYYLIDENDNYIDKENIVVPNKLIEIKKTSQNTEIITGKYSNFIQLKHYPILANALLTVKVDEKNVVIVNEYSGSNLQAMFINDFVYFNYPLKPENSVTISYEYYPDYIYLRTEMRINSDTVVTDCPEIVNLLIKVMQ